MTNITVELLDYVYEGGVIDWDASVLGQLDVTSHSDFPMALTSNGSCWPELSQQIYSVAPIGTAFFSPLSVVAASCPYYKFL